MTSISLNNLIILAGIAQILLCLVSLSIPGLLNWKIELAKLNPLLKQMFWTYAGYILGINFFFGFISITASKELITPSKLSIALTFLISLYWIGRLFIQFFYFDRSQAPKGLIYSAGEVFLVSLFLFFSAVYSFAFFYNF